MSEHLWNVNMLRCPKHCLNNHGSILALFFDQSGVGVGTLMAVKMLKAPKKSLNLHDFIFITFFEYSGRKSAPKILS